MLKAWTNKLPKKITICGRRWKIKYNMKGGCSFDYRKRTTTVGCNCGEDSAVEGLIHEISEVVHVEMRNRFMKTGNGENGDYLFSMDHSRFELHNMWLVAALRECGLLRK